MKGATKKSLCVVLTAALLVSGIAVPGVAEAKKSKVKISKKKLTLTVGQKKKLKVKGTKKKIKWSSNKKKVATVTKKGVVKAKKKGTAKITAKVGRKKYTCKVTVKAKKTTAKATPKPTAKSTGGTGTTTPNGTGSPNYTMYPGGSYGPGNTNNPGNTNKPGNTNDPGGNNTPSPGASNDPTGNTPLPGDTTGPDATPLPDYTSEPSDEDTEPAPAVITLSTGNSWNNYRKNLGRVTVETGTTAELTANGLADWSIDWKNTHGTALSMEELLAHEEEDYGEGQFWENHWKSDHIIELEEGINTIYVRLKAYYGIREEIYYLNSDNIVVQRPQETPGPGPDDPASPSQSPTNPTATPSQTPVTGERGKDVDLQGKTAFEIGSGNHTYKLALGLSKEKVKEILGDLSLDILREEKSPQGFDVIAFRQDGNDTSADNTDRYKTYILIYLQNDQIVSITAIAPSMKYGDVDVGNLSLTKLTGDGWKGSNWYKTTDGAAGAYTNTINGDQAIAYIDYYGDKNTYCLQISSSQYTEDIIANPKESWLRWNLNYSDEAITTAMATETGELINAYLANTGLRVLSINTKMSNAAKTFSESLANREIINANQITHTNEQIKTTIEGAGLTVSGAWAESILIGNMDAIGFANSAIESSNGKTKARDYICNSDDYSVMGLGAANYYDVSYNYPNLVIEYAKSVKNK